MAELTVVVSEDGSHTLFNPVLDETYHSIHGAIQESNHVFIASGLHYLLNLFPKTPIRILEVGFGTGLNALLSLDTIKNTSNTVHYTTFETYPLPSKITQTLNYTQKPLLEQYKIQFEQMHAASWNEKHQISPNFSITKIDKSILALNEGNFNLIYFDAFAPNKQSEMWQKSVFEHIVGFCDANTVFVTYCAKGQVRRDLQSLGFEVERIPGPPGKREMLRGVLKNSLQGFKKI